MCEVIPRFFSQRRLDRICCRPAVKGNDGMRTIFGFMGLN